MSSYSDDEDAPQDKEAVAYGMVLNLVMLSVAATIGLFYSCKFFHSPDVMVIPGQSPAQSFVMFASALSALYCIIHGLACLRDTTIYHDASSKRPSDNDQRWFKHILYSWAVLLAILSFTAWATALIIVLVVWKTRMTTTATTMNLTLTRTAVMDDKQTYHLEFVHANLVACGMGLLCTLVTMLVLWRADRPFAMPRCRSRVRDKRLRRRFSGSVSGSECGSSGKRGSFASSTTVTSSIAGSGDFSLGGSGKDGKGDGKGDGKEGGGGGGQKDGSATKSDTPPPSGGGGGDKAAAPSGNAGSG